MTVLRTLPVALCLSLASAAVPFAPGEAHAQSTGEKGAPVQLKVGGRQTVSVANIARVAVGDPEVADIRIAGTNVEITGRAAGSTQLLIWRQDGVRVSYPIAVTR